MYRPFSEQEKESIRHKFDYYCKKVLRGAAINYDKKNNYLAEHEIPIAGLPENIYQLTQMDKYFQQNYFFEVSGENILVKGEDIAHMISILPVLRREIILLSYFTDMSDSEISDKLNMRRQTVQYQRKAALTDLRKILEGDQI